MKLLGNKIIATPLNKEEFTRSGLVVPDFVNKTGDAIPVTVLFIGTEFQFKKEVKVGDTVFVSKRFGDPINIQDYLHSRIYSGDDILAIIG